MLSSLVAVDRNLESSFALRWACALGGRVRPVHVVDSPVRDMSFGIGWARKSWEQDAVDQARRELAGLLQAERHQCPAIEEPLVMAGDTVQQVETAFQQQNLDLLVMGLPFRGLEPGGLIKRFGPLADKASLEIPALLVRGLGPLKRLCALTDGGRLAEDALGVLARAMPASGGEISLIGVSSGESADPQAEARHLQRGAAILREKGLTPQSFEASEMGEEALLEHLGQADLVACPLLLEDKRHHHLSEFCQSRCQALLVILGGASK
ncbi:MAG: universal stress protein [Pseudomonadota bacterium]